jgi:nucleotide-binding universal stress UspA family protein
MKIMVGYDGSDASKEAVKVAKKRAKVTDAKVYVLTSMMQGSEKKIQDIGKAERELDYVKSVFILWPTLH